MIIYLCEVSQMTKRPGHKVREYRVAHEVKGFLTLMHDARCKGVFMVKAQLSERHIESSLRSFSAMVNRVLLTFIYFLLAFSLLMISACSDPAKAFTRHVERADSYLEKDKYEEARIELLNSLKYRPEDVDTLLKLARVQIQLGAYQQAAMAYRTILKQEPDNRNIALEYSRLLYAGKGFSEIKRVLTPIEESNPDDLEVLLLLSSSLVRLGEGDTAAAHAERATALAPGEAKVWLNLTQIRIIAKDFTGAEVALEKAETISPQSENLIQSRIDLNLAQNRPDEAASLFQKLISENPKNRRYRIRYANLLEKLNRAEQAKDIYLGLVGEEEDPVIRNKIGLLMIHLKEEEQAIINWRKAIELRDTFIEPRLNLARLYLSKGKTEKGLEEVQAVLELDSENPAGLVLRGSTSLDDRKYREAISDLITALESNPENSEARFLLAQAQLGSGDRQAARQTLRDILVKDPSHSRARLSLARMERALGSLEESSHHARIISRDPVYGNTAMLLLGDNVQRQGNLKDAETIYRRTEKLFKQSPRTRFRIAETLSRQGRVDQAITIYQSLLKDRPGNLPTLSSLVRAFLSQDRTEEALKVAREQANSGNPSLRYFYGVTLERTGNIDEAKEVYRDILDKEPGFSRVYSSLVQLLARQGELDEAEKWLKQAVEEKSEAPGFQVLLGMIYDLKGDKNEAIDSYRNALKLKADFGPALNNLAWNLLEKGELDEALRFASQAKEKSPEDPLVRDTYGWILYKKGEVLSAVDELNAAAESMPNNPEIRNHLAEALEELGRNDEALEHRKAAEKILAEREKK